MTHLTSSHPTPYLFPHLLYTLTHRFAPFPYLFHTLTLPGTPQPHIPHLTPLKPFTSHPTGSYKHPSHILSPSHCTHSIIFHLLTYSSFISFSSHSGSLSNPTPLKGVSLTPLTSFTLRQAFRTLRKY